MRRIPNIYRAICLLAVFPLLVWSCRGAGPTEEGPASRRQNELAYDERGFDPLELPSDTQLVPVQFPVSGDLHGEDQVIDIVDHPAGLFADGLTADREDIDTVNSQAFRVQLFTSKLYGEARRALAVAEEIFDCPVRIDYEVPYYKVRVGGFADRDDAEDYRQRAKAAGYSEAWVVVTAVGVKSTEPLYDEVIPVDSGSATNGYEGDDGE